jgi:hypothetical protein
LADGVEDFDAFNETYNLAVDHNSSFHVKDLHIFRTS